MEKEKHQFYLYIPCGVKSVVLRYVYNTVQLNTSNIVILVSNMASYKTN